MSALITLGLRLARAGGPLRAWSVLVGNAFGMMLVLLTIALPAALYPDPVQRSEMRVNLIASLIFLIVPAVVLLFTVGRLSSGVRDRRLAALRMIGLTPMRARVVAAVENGALATVGTVAGSAVFLLVAEPLGSAALRGTGWLRGPLAISPVVVVVAVVAVVTLSVALGTAATWRRELPAAARSESAHRAPSPWRLLVPATGAAILVAVDVIESTVSREMLLLSMLLAGVLVTAVGIAVVTPLMTGWCAAAIARWRSHVGLTLAARSMQSDAVGTSRVVAGLGVAVFLVTGALGFLGMIEHLPHMSAAIKAYGDGPQLIRVSGASDGAVVTPADRDGIERLPGVLGVVPQRTAETPCGEGGGSCQVFVGTCAELALVQVVAGCDDSRAARIVEDRTGADVSDLWQPASVPEGADIDPVLWTGSGDVSLGRQSTVGAPIVAKVAAQVERWSDRASTTAFVPLGLVPDLPAPTGVDVVAVGGTQVQTEVTSWAEQRGLRAELPNTVSYRTLGQVRAVTWALSGVALLVAVLALALTAADRALERRRAVARQVMVGVPARVLRQGQLLQTLVPGLVAGGLALAAGTLGARAFASIVHERVLIGPASWGTLAALVVAGALLASLSTLPLIRVRIAPHLLRRE